MDGFTVAGGQGFTACEIDGGAAGQLNSYIDVATGTPALYAAIADPASDRLLGPAAGTLAVTGPDGTRYTAAANTATQFAVVSSGQLQALYLLQPQPGRWRIACAAPGSAGFRAMLATVPVPVTGAQPLNAELDALRAHYPGDTSGSLDQVGFALLRWGLWPLAAVLATASGTSGLMLDLAGAITAAFGLDAAQAAAAVTAMAGQSATGALLTIAQQGELVPPATVMSVLADGAAEDGLAGWQITANGGDGWAVQSGYSDAIDYAHNFAASYAWCRKQQTVDLVGQAGLTAAFLDTAPDITVTDWVAAPAPDGETLPSSYQLTAQLLDGAGAPMKEVTTGVLTLPPVGPKPQWHRIQVTFTGYGPGVRSVLFAHGGQDARQWDRAYGVKMTGADVAVQLAPPAYIPAELLVNGSGQQAMTGWTNTSTAGDPWTVDPGAGLSCPAGPGATAFAVAAGNGAKQQVVDLVAAGLRPDFLDTSPTLQAAQWIAAAPGTACGYGMTAELLDANQAVLATLDSGTVQVAAAPLRFSQLAQTISGYPAGVRSVRFTHRAQPAVDGQGPARIAAASLQVLVAQPPQQAAAQPTVTSAMTSAAAAPWNRVANPGSRPYWWICFLRQTPVGSPHPYLGSGALIDPPQMLLTAAHNIAYRDPTKDPVVWIASIQATPGSGSAGTAGGMALQIPIEWLLVDQVRISYHGLYDYGLVRISGSGWQPGGFAPTAEQDSVVRGQAATITAFPGEAPFVSGTMYTQDVTLDVYDETQATIDTSFTAGASGGAVYVRGTEQAVGVYSHGSWAGFGSQYMTRLDARALDNLKRWSRPPAPADRVCSMQLVIHTGNVARASTGDPIQLTLGGQATDLDALWMPMSGNPSQAKDTDHFDGYDLTPFLRTAFPDGLTVGSLHGMAYELHPTANTGWLDNGWYVSSLNFFVNGQRYHMHNTDSWILSGNPPWDVLTGTLP